MAIEMVSLPSYSMVEWWIFPVRFLLTFTRGLNGDFLWGSIGDVASGYDMTNSSPWIPTVLMGVSCSLGTSSISIRAMASMGEL